MAHQEVVIASCKKVLLAMIDHTCLQVSSARISRSFYEQALALGLPGDARNTLGAPGGAIWLGMRVPSVGNQGLNMERRGLLG